MRAAPGRARPHATVFHCPAVRAECFASTPPTTLLCCRRRSPTSMRPASSSTIPAPGPAPSCRATGQTASRRRSSRPILAAGIALDGSKNDQLLAALQLIRGFQAFVVNGNFIVPAGIIRVTSLVWGGGGAGGGTSSGGGAGGGGFALKRCTVTPGQTIAVTVSPQASPGPPAQPGGTSSFGAFCSATGGADRSGRWSWRRWRHRRRRRSEYQRCARRHQSCRRHSRPRRRRPVRRWRRRPRQHGWHARRRRRWRHRLQWQQRRPRPRGRALVAEKETYALCPHPGRSRR